MKTRNEALRMGMKMVAAMVLGLGMLIGTGFGAEVKDGPKKVYINLDSDFEHQRVKISVMHGGEVTLVFDKRITTEPVLGFAKGTEAMLAPGDVLRIEVEKRHGYGGNFDYVVPSPVKKYCLVELIRSTLQVRWQDNIPLYD